MGAVPMLIHPNGLPFHMPVSLLRYLPFYSFKVPGLLLLLTNGSPSLIILWIVRTTRLGYGWWVGGQGLVLAAWLLGEIVMLRGADWLHALYGRLAISPVWIGIRLQRRPSVTAAGVKIKYAWQC